MTDTQTAPMINSKQIPVYKSPIARSVKSGLMRPDDEVHIADLPDVNDSIDYASFARPYSPQSRAKRAFNKVSGKSNITQELKQLGYSIIEEIGTKDPQCGDSRIKYLKVCNQMGQTAFIEIGPEDGIVAVNTKNLTTVEMNAVSVIPQSIKEGSFRQAGHDTAGVALICENNICILTRTDDTERRQEKNFVYIQSYNDRRGILGDNPTSYPVVRLSEVRANPKLVTQNINDATRRIRVAARQAADADLVNLQKKLNELSEQVRLFQTNLGAKYNSTVKELTELETYQNHYLGCLPGVEAEKEKMEKCQCNLTSRNNLISTLILCSNAVCEEECKIGASLERIKQINQLCDEKYREARGVAPPKANKQNPIVEVKTGGKV